MALAAAQEVESPREVRRVTAPVVGPVQRRWLLRRLRDQEGRQRDSEEELVGADHVGSQRGDGEAAAGGDDVGGEVD